MTLHRKIEHNEKVCRAEDLGSYAQGQGRNQVKGQNLVSAITQKTTEANLMTLHRKIEHNEGVSRTKVRFLRPRSRSQSGQRSKSCLSNNSKTTEANLSKLHRKIEHNEKVCRAKS